jgi:nucleoid-associated protein YgaU
VPTRALISLELDRMQGDFPMPPAPPPPPMPVTAKAPAPPAKFEAKRGGPSAGSGSAAGGSLGPAKFGAMNPTSRGVPGRTSVLIRAADSLPSVALSCYGDASLWRDLAEANGLDDPLRVRPGTVLLVPARSEVGS